MDVNRRRRNVCIADVGPGRINRLNDRFVKYLFGVEAHKNLLLDFINDVLFPEGEARFESIELLNSELSQGGNDLKLVRNVFHKQEGEDVILILRAVHTAAQTVAACPKT